ncbi:MAG: DUF72 domain-containing protein [Acidobacteriaceae bacterium]
MEWYLGTIGFSYRDWIGAFYPAGLPQKGFLSFYCKSFNCVEVDTSFHSIPPPSAVQSWYSITPDQFRFCFKTPHHITHELMLNGAQGAMNEFVDVLKPLGEKLGPLLIQLPPRFTQASISRLSDFLASLAPGNQYAVEFRHRSWYNDTTTQLLSDHKVGWVATDFPNLPKQINLSANFIYIRWIGVNGTYQRHSYERVDKTTQLNWWLEQLRAYQDGVPALYGFFNNDYAGFAAGTCKRFKQLAGLDDVDNEVPYQARLF